MTQLRILPEGSAPATHVLVIGVGHYRHLIGGPEPRKRGAHLGLKVLQSPPLSAEKFVRWCLGSDGGAQAGLNNPEAPLATVEVLISSAAPVSFAVAASAAAVEVEGATLEQVRKGFDRWLEEVQGDPGNVGVIYFCGHGITGNGPEQYLLLEDHASSQNRPFETGSFDMTSTLRALWRTVPAQLYVFVDACRSYDRRVASLMKGGPGPLLEEPPSTLTVTRGTMLVEATGEGEPAYGDSEDVSRFTAALLLALQGYCGVARAGTSDWLVNGEALSQSIRKLLAWVNKQREGPEQSCTPHPSGPDDTAMHIRASPPNVKVEIALSPIALVADADYRMSDLVRQGAAPVAGALDKGVWKAEALKGQYAIRVLSTQRSFREFKSDQEYVEPPTYRLPVRVGP